MEKRLIEFGCVCEDVEDTSDHRGVKIPIPDKYFGGGKLSNV